MRRTVAVGAASVVLILVSILVGASTSIAVPFSPGRTILRPAIVWRPIPFGPRRRAEMAAYSQRHYGSGGWRLVGPHVIVEHYTDGSTFAGAWATMASNAPHLGELPGTCSHFVIDTDGTIYQLVPLGTRCRHAIGMNWTAFGIEHVGTSDQQILSNPAMMRASLDLTVWLMARYHISAANVIGHAETLMSPYHHELYPSWRCMTHSDWLHADMQIYRARLRTLARHLGVPVGPPPRWVDPHC